MALTKVRAPRTGETAEPERRNLLGSWWVLGAAAIALFVAFGWSFLRTSTWDVPHQQYGALPFIFGTFVSASLALVIAVPLGVGCAAYLSYLVLAVLPPLWHAGAAREP